MGRVLQQEQRYLVLGEQKPEGDLSGRIEKPTGRLQGWMGRIRPPPSGDKYAALQYLNIFSGKVVSDRDDIPEFVVDTSASKKRHNEEDEAEKYQKKAVAHYNNISCSGNGKTVGGDQSRE